MRKFTYFLLTSGMVWCVLLMGERPAYAYIDPGSGLFLLQSIGAACLGVIYVVKRKVKALTGRKPKAEVNGTRKTNEA